MIATITVFLVVATHMSYSKHYRRHHAAEASPGQVHLDAATK